uniref:IS1353 orf n=1 Tax=Shigella flexneri serotype 5a (strain M90T) TaxID=1086030 RepID=Q9AFS7_SHIFM|nr:IS1353 orf [Shigella flexneri 5a str. M90T]
MVDCFDGKVVSWSLSTRPDAELVNTMLDSAVETLNAGERPVIHSDRGGHYRWVPSAPKCTANNAGWNDKAVQEIIRIPPSPFGLSAPPNMLFP